MVKKLLPGSILFFLQIFSTSLTGSAPGERIKKIGILGSESSTAYSRISAKVHP